MQIQTGIMNDNEEKNIRDRVIAEVRRIASEHNLTTVTGSIFKKYSNISINQITRKFDGGITEVNELAGLKPDTSRKKKTENELWEELLRVCKLLEKVPGRVKFNFNSNFSDSPYIKRYHNWPNVLVNFKKWLEKTDPSSRFNKLLSNKTDKRKTVSSIDPGSAPRKFVWQRKKNTFYGAPMNFRGLMYEPINEQGVVFLFGKISEEIGFNIEAIKPGFPDCEGKRLVDKNKNLWEQVSIEFEYESQNFLDHGHDSNKCDVIICWVHNWQQCNVEVIELKKIVSELMRRENKSSLNLRTSV